MANSLNYLLKLRKETQKNNNPKIPLEQNPQILAISCSDSRADPAHILNSDIGDVFCIRNIAGIIPEYNKSNSVSAAIDFVVSNFDIKNIVIVGHGCCAGICSTLDIEKNINDKFNPIENWLSHLTKNEEFNKNKIIAKAKPNKENIDNLIKSAIDISYNNLKNYDIIKKHLNININKLFFEIPENNLYSYDMKLKKYIKI